LAVITRSVDNGLIITIPAPPADYDERALNYYQRFKWAVIVELPPREWILTSEEVRQALVRLQDREPVEVP